VRSVRLIGNSTQADDAFRFTPCSNATGFANALIIGTIAPGRFETGFENGQSAPGQNVRTVTVNNVEGASCRVVPNAGRAGKAGLVLDGEARGDKATHVYYAVFETPVAVGPSSILRYWIKPENELGRSSGVDLIFQDNSNLRDSQARDLNGQSLHPGQPKGPVGQWTKIECPIGNWHAGKVIKQVVLAFDRGPSQGQFKTVVDDLYIGAPTNAPTFSVQAKPEGGSYPARLMVDLVVSPKNGRVCYTLDGSMPVGTSPVYEKPIVFDKPGAYEVRFQALDGSSNAVTTVSSRLYDVR